MWQAIMLEVGNEPLVLVFVLIAAFISATIHSVSGLAGALILLIFLVPIFDIKTAFSILSNYDRPKKIYIFSKFPFTETGKIKRSELLNNLDQATEIIQQKKHK